MPAGRFGFYPKQTLSGLIKLMLETTTDYKDQSTGEWKTCLALCDEIRNLEFPKECPLKQLVADALHSPRVAEAVAIWINDAAVEYPELWPLIYAARVAKGEIELPPVDHLRQAIVNAHTKLTQKDKSKCKSG